jgi:hypothetical protein
MTKRKKFAKTIDQYFMFPETYGRTLEELAFLFEDRALAEEAAAKVEKQIAQELEEWGGPKSVKTHITATGDERFERFERWVGAGSRVQDRGDVSGESERGWGEEGGRGDRWPGVHDKFSRWP